MVSVEESDVVGGPRTPRIGLPSSSEARALVSENFSGKAYCLVEDWTVFRIDVTSEELTNVHAAGQLPMIVFAHNVIEDSHPRLHEWHRRLAHGDTDQSDAW